MSDSWTLQIRYTQLRDMGEYQCQVNTEPKISLSVFLQVSGEQTICRFEVGSFAVLKNRNYISSFYLRNLFQTEIGEQVQWW